MCSARGEGQPGSLVREIELNVLECKVCFERFGSSPPRRPCALPCGHAVCRHCASALCRQPRQGLQPAADGQLQCPFCRRSGPLSLAADCLPLLQLAELLAGAAAEPTGGRWPELAAVFGGWGLLVNPRGLAVCRSSGAVAVAHDGEQSLRLFERGGRPLLGFGPLEQLRYPLDVALAGGGRLLVVTDAGDSSVKVFASQAGGGAALTVIRGGFGLPWGVDAGSAERVAVTDAGRGSLLLLTLQLPGGALLSQDSVCERLCCPREVAVSPLDGCIHVVEHLQPRPGQRAGRLAAVRLKTFNSQRQLIRQVDNFGLTPSSSVPLGISAIAVDSKGNVLLADGDSGTVACVSTLENFQRRTIIDHGLVRPVALAWTGDDTLIVLDAGDHTWKVYTSCKTPSHLCKVVPCNSTRC
ncbi:E3 ubiquitin-protein ligase NHLRC1-like [Heterodontus francisci]|uniref:E3 ubiquitin-protein ligase NHLRC1-like n=1 Tax=Heterodontus francisci TaxID=7792 RepID=UPI00355B0CD8